MQFDQSHIAIRQRSLLEVMDLALHVSRTFAPGLAVCWAIGVLPMAIVNQWLLGHWLPDEVSTGWPVACGMAQLGLVVVQAPLATAPMTLLLGQRMFRQRTDESRIVRDFLASLPQLVALQVVVRAVCLPVLVTLALPLGVWPYVNEVILLERNTMVSPWRRRLNTVTRCRALHAGASSELFGRWMTLLFLAGLLTVSLWLSLWIVLSILSGAHHSMRTGVLFYWPAALWATTGYLAVVRFLSYLDLRLRREGWEVVLRLRAEAARLARSVP